LRARLSTALSTVALFTIASHAPAVLAQDTEEADPWGPMARLVGGAWHMGDSHQVFEWGPGKLALHGRSYRGGEDGPMEVGRGMFYYHPGDGAVRGVFTGVGMGIDLFDYTAVTVEDDRLVFDLRTYGAMAGRFEEVWEFAGDDQFEWSLAQVTDDGTVEMMAGTFVRERE
jgi:hypothetical protein